jgi:hypothetical protein
MKREKEVQANPDIDFSQMNVAAFYATLIKIIEKREGIKIKYTLREKTPEEFAADPNKLVEVSDSVRMQLREWGTEL